LTLDYISWNIFFYVVVVQLRECLALRSSHALTSSHSVLPLHPAVFNSVQTAATVIIVEARLLSPAYRDSSTEPTTATWLATSSRLQYLQVGTLYVVAALRSSGHDACRPTTSTLRANPKILLPPSIQSASPLPVFHPPRLHQRTRKHMCVCLMTQVKRLLIIFASYTKNRTKQVIWGCDKFGTSPVARVKL
jgi:hypothetical protein